MLIVVSPAKTLDFETPANAAVYSQPRFLEQSETLVTEMRKMAPQDISNLMGVSDKIASLNAARYEQWQQPFTPENAKQAVLAFKGDVYTGLDAETLNEDGLTFAQSHLRILSGLYGVLRPLDLMQPYRLEMGIKLANEKGSNLYQFWGEEITKSLNQELASNDNAVLINLASNEYFKSVKPKVLNADVITPVFKDEKNGKYKIISFYAKKARGLMARYIIDNRINDPEQLKAFNVDGYYFKPEESSAKDWVFYRDHAE